MDNKELFISLLNADTEEEVISLLKKTNYWEDENAWRFYGDKENNYKDAGNQAAEAEASLVEKITNSRDARLLNECLVRGIDPEGPDAPKTLEAAVAKFFDENVSDDDLQVQKNGVTLLVDAMSLQYLEDAEIDYKEDLQGSQSVIRNPNATTTCGCGSSFSLDD